MGREDEGGVCGMTCFDGILFKGDVGESGERSPIMNVNPKFSRNERVIRFKANRKIGVSKDEVCFKPRYETD